MTLNKSISFLFFVFAALVLGQSCQKSEELKPAAISDVSGKIINKPVNFDSSSIMVKVSKCNDAIESALLAIEGVTGIEKIFPSVPGKEDLEKECGLDRWYDILLEASESSTKGAEMNAVKVAQSVAALSDVIVVEYPQKVEKAYTGEAVPFSAKADIQTKSRGRNFNDPLLQYQWGLYNNGSSTIDLKAKTGADINVYNVWSELTCGDPSIVVAVLDEGVQYTHPDLAANMWMNEKELSGTKGIDDDGNGYIDDIYGWNFTMNKSAISWNDKDDTGHGTHCAGIISAVNNNKVGICGIAGGSGKNDGCKIMSLQIYDGKFGGSEKEIAKAFKYAADNGASVASCSWSSVSLYSSDNEYKSIFSIEADAIDYFEKSKNNTVVDGGIIVFSAGNSALPSSDYPGAMQNMISVTALGPDGLPAYYTNYGPGCNICAPGGEYLSYESYPYNTIVSTLPEDLSDGKGYGFMQGTSMACPHVSGIAALAISYAKQLGRHYSLNEFKDMLLTSATDIDNLLVGEKISEGGYTKLKLYEYKKKMGAGAIDTWQLMMKIEGTPSIITKVGGLQWVDVKSYFGTAATTLTFLGVEVEEGSSITFAEAPYMQYGRLFVNPASSGSARLVISAIAGGDTVGGGDSIGGKEVKQVVSIIAKGNKSDNGGWF